jgi:predicted DNA-binding transcriptional regulator YafY
LKSIGACINSNRKNDFIQSNQPRQFKIRRRLKRTTPNSNVIAALMRAINNRRAVSCEDMSLSSPESKRIIIPHAITNNGQRWHVRVFDKKLKEFRNSVCTRLQSVNEINKPIAKTQAGECDNARHNLVEVRLAVHPSIYSI